MSALPLLKFTPSAQDPEILELITVQREGLLTTLVDAALDHDGGLRHHLLVGPRGMGKSHVLTIVADRIRKASAPVVVAAMEEDPWAVRSYGKFLAAVLAEIARELGDTELGDTAARLRSRSGRDAEDDGERLLREAVGDRRLVLIIENLDEIFRRIGKDGQGRLRAFSENWSQMLILGSTPQLFDGVSRHTSPFYGFFRVTHLEELTPDSAAELLRRVAELRKDEALVKFLATETARRRLLAINALAGGHPRIWLLFAGCISIAAIDELVPLFLEALDDLTPYYQDRLRELGDQQQELVVLLCEAGGALSNRDLAERSGIAQNQVAATLGQLEKKAYVRRATLPSPLNTGDARVSHWELREPLMRLSLDVKQSRGRPLELVVAFLRAWYGTRILDEMLRLPDTAHLALDYASTAFRGLQSETLLRDLMRGSAEQVVARAERGLMLEPKNLTLAIARATGLTRMGRVEEALAIFATIRDEAASDDFVSTVIEIALTHALIDARETIDERRLRHILERIDATIEGEPRNPEYVKLRGLVLRSLGRHEDALGAFTLAAQLEPDDPANHSARGISLVRLGRPREALDAYGRAAQLDPESSMHEFNRAMTLDSLGALGEAEESILRAIDLDTTDGRSWSLAAGIACARGDDRSLVPRLEQALAIYDVSSGVQADIAYRLCSRLARRVDDAEATIAVIVEIYAAAGALSQLNIALATIAPELYQLRDDPLRWLSQWQRPSQEHRELAIGLLLADGIAGFVVTRDQKTLMRLPAELRQIAVTMIESRHSLKGGDDGLELGDDVT